MKFTSVLAVADKPTLNGNVYSKECLEQMAKTRDNFYVEGDTLYYEHDLTIVGLRPVDGTNYVSMECRIRQPPEL